jgi:SAM-dependent methyltransferase
MIDDIRSRYYAKIPSVQQMLISSVESAISATPNAVVLDAGCGSRATLVERFAKMATVYGVDLDCIDCGNIRRADLAELPFPDAMFDIVYSRSVWEHLTDPEKVMSEVGRVLKPGGLLILTTPNKYDYTSLVARLTPQWFHRWAAKKVGLSYDMFEVHYRCNTPSWFRRLAGWEKVGLRGLRHHPVNLQFSRILYRFGILYDWLLARLRLNSLQPTLLVILRKS